MVYLPSSSARSMLIALASPSCNTRRKHQVGVRQQSGHLSRQLQLAFLLALTMLVLCACSQQPRSIPILATTPADSTPAAVATPVTSEEIYTVGLVMKTLTNPFFIDMEQGARQAERELGIKLVVKTGSQETSIEQQITLIYGLIDAGVDAIVVAPADSRELVRPLAEAQAAGIAIVNVDNPLDPAVMASLGVTNVPLVTVDNEQGGYLSAQYLARQVTEPAEAVILEGIRSAQNAEDRKQGALRAFAENPLITLVAMESANWKIDEGYTVAAQLFDQYPNIKVVFAANDMMALGVIEYLKDRGHDDVLVAGYDALAEVEEPLRSGRLLATIDQQAALQGYTAIQLAVDMVKGNAVPDTTFVDVALVTGETLNR